MFRIFHTRYRSAQLWKWFADHLRNDAATDKFVGRRLEQLRLSKELSVAAVADYVHIREEQILRFELGKGRVPAKTLFDLARLFNVSVDALFCEHGA